MGWLMTIEDAVLVVFLTLCARTKVSGVTRDSYDVESMNE